MNFFLTAQAATIQINPNLPGTGDPSTLPGVIQNFYAFALALAGIIAFGAIVYGGVRYATGKGNPSSESVGKEWIQNALLGLLLLAGAWIILYTINPNLVSLQLPGLPTLQPPPSGGNGGGNNICPPKPECGVPPKCSGPCPEGQSCSADSNGNYSCEGVPPPM